MFYTFLSMEVAKLRSNLFRNKPGSKRVKAMSQPEVGETSDVRSESHSRFVHGFPSYPSLLIIFLGGSGGGTRLEGV